jgi:hypothetical protein
VRRSSRAVTLAESSPAKNLPASSWRFICAAVRPHKPLTRQVAVPTWAAVATSPISASPPETVVREQSSPSTPSAIVDGPAS